ncbi:MAG: tRNA(His) guanylyltransferase Thg1 family protein [Myxococcota bacterium]
MSFDELNTRMRIFETAHDHRVLPGMFTVARLDGRGFTRLTKEVHRFEAPFDPRFRDLMVHTTRHLMQNTGLSFAYGHTHSDELSLLLLQAERSFGRKLRKWNSVLAGEASAAFSLALGHHAVLDCRISQMPQRQQVLDYFRWRQADAHRNALNAHCYWALRNEGMSQREATARLSGRSVGDKNELLFRRGINFNELPAWHKRGIGFWWEPYEKRGINPKTGEQAVATRRRLNEEALLPVGAQYDALVQERIDEAEASGD